MANTTTNLKLRKPAGGDTINVQTDIFDNIQIIDDKVVPNRPPNGSEPQIYWNGNRLMVDSTTDFTGDIRVQNSFTLPTISSRGSNAGKSGKWIRLMRTPMTVGGNNSITAMMIYQTTTFSFAPYCGIFSVACRHTDGKGGDINDIGVGMGTTYSFYLDFHWLCGVEVIHPEDFAIGLERTGGAEYQSGDTVYLVLYLRKHLDNQAHVLQILSQYKNTDAAMITGTWESLYDKITPFDSIEEAVGEGLVKGGYVYSDMPIDDFKTTVEIGAGKCARFYRINTGAAARALFSVSRTDDLRHLGDRLSIRTSSGAMEGYTESNLPIRLARIGSRVEIWVQNNTSGTITVEITPEQYFSSSGIRPIEDLATADALPEAGVGEYTAVYDVGVW